MTSWKPRRLSPRGPVYVAIADALASDVGEGRLQPGERLPTHRSLAAELGVNVVTVTRAYAEAARRGLVQGEVGRGTFVRFTPREEPPRPAAEARGPLRVDLEMGVPHTPPELLASAAFFRELADDPSGAHLDEGYRTSGLDEHRASAARWLARAGLDARPERLLVTCGAQHALFVAIGALCEPGHTLLLPDLTYPGVKALASTLRLRTAPVKSDDEGLVPEAFEDACRRASARVLFCTPNVQNPTGAVLPAERRQAIAALARRYDVVIVEDDTAGFVLDAPPPPFARFAPERAVFVTSTAKSMAPGLRIGFLHAPDSELGARLFAHASSSSWMTPPAMAALAARWIDDGTADAIVAWKRRELRARRALFERVFGPEASRSHPAAPFVWLPLPPPWRPADLARQARARGVAVSPAETFAAGRAEAPHAVRLSIGRPPSAERALEGFELLHEVLAGAPELGNRIV